MDELFGYIVVVCMICVLVYELIRQIQAFSLSKENTKNNVLILLSLAGILIGYCLNIFVNVSLITSPYITSNGTSLAVFICIISYGYFKFSQNLQARKYTQSFKSLLK